MALIALGPLIAAVVVVLLVRRRDAMLDVPLDPYPTGSTHPKG